MSRKSHTVRPGAEEAPVLDDTDRRLLGLLARDASRSYAQLGELLHLSPPAVYERVKRLKSAKVIKGTGAILDPMKIGRPLLAFVHVSKRDWEMTRQMQVLAELPEVEEIHTVTGDCAMLLKVRVQNPQALETLIARIHSIEGCVSTRSYIALSSFLERVPQL
jgi:Lrp/AsnC family transcriptional regulator, leucine-responsive regulatory protein